MSISVSKIKSNVPAIVSLYFIFVFFFSRLSTTRQFDKCLLVATVRLPWLPVSFLLRVCFNFYYFFFFFFSMIEIKSKKHDHYYYYYYSQLNVYLPGEIQKERKVEIFFFSLFNYIITAHHRFFFFSLLYRFDVFEINSSLV